MAVVSGVESGQPRIILVDVNDESRDVMVRRLGAQGYSVEAASDPASGADMALSSPPSAVIADLWMPSISGVQLCRLLRAEAATADVPVILRGDLDDPRSRFWAERAGATAYVRKGRMGELVRVLSKAVEQHTPTDDGFFMQLSGGNMDIRDRIARHLDAALFDSVIAAEVRALAACGSFDRLFDLFSQFLSQLISYRWLAIRTTSPECFALHHHPHSESSEAEARAALGLNSEMSVLRVVDEDPQNENAQLEPIICDIPFANVTLGRIAIAPSAGAEADTAGLLRLVARELGGPVRMAALVDEQQRLAAIDPLTGLMNRRSFLAQMEIEIARARRYGLPLSVLLMDVDHFKHINDGHGHAGGDQVLTSMGSLLRKQLRVPDLAARWGGEEFVVALTNTNVDGGLVVGERIRMAIQELQVSHADVKIPVTASVGLAAFDGIESVDALIDRADRAMYCAKVGGRNRLMLSEQDVHRVSEQAPSAHPSSVPHAPIEPLSQH